MSTLKRLAAAAALSLTALLTGCTDDSAGGDGALATGVLTDSPIANVPYRTPTQAGVTNAAGEYLYRRGEKVTFIIGGVEFTVPATGIISPAEIAAALFGDNLEAVFNATQNLAILFQSLDADADPENGIELPEEFSLGDFNPLNDLLQSPTAFAAGLGDFLPEGYSAVDPAAAVAHYYRNALHGNWRLVEIESFIEEAPVPAAVGRAIRAGTLGIIVTVDEDSRFSYTEWNIASGFDRLTATAWGEIALPETTSDFMPFTFDVYAGNAGMLPGAFGGLIGNRLLIVTEGYAMYLERFEGVPGRLTGSWMLTQPGGARDSLGNPLEAMGLLHVIDGSRAILTVPGSNAALVSWRYRNNQLEFTELLAGEAEILPSFGLGASYLNDTRRPLTFGDESGVLQRLLSPGEFRGAFAHTVPYQSEEQVTDYFSNDAVESEGGVLACTQPGPDSETWVERLFVFDALAGTVTITDPRDGSTLIGEYNGETGEFLVIDYGDLQEIDNRNGTRFYVQRDEQITGQYIAEEARIEASRVVEESNTWSYDGSTVSCDVTFAIDAALQPQLAYPMP